MEQDLVASNRLKYLQKQIDAQLQGKYADITIVSGYLSMVHSIILDLIQTDFDENYHASESKPSVSDDLNFNKTIKQETKQEKNQDNQEKDIENDQIYPKNETYEQLVSISKSSENLSKETPVLLEIAWSIFHYPVFQFLKHQLTSIKYERGGNSGKNDVELRKANESTLKVILLVRKFYLSVIEKFTEDYDNALIPTLVLNALSLKNSFKSLVSPVNLKMNNANRLQIVHKCILHMGDISRYRASLAILSSAKVSTIIGESLSEKLEMYLKALEYYKMCILLIPSINQPYNHIGLIYNAVNEHYTACYWFLRLCCTRIPHFKLGSDNFISTMAKDTYLKVAIDAMRSRFISLVEFNAMVMCVVGYHLNTIKTKNGDEIAPRVPYTKLLHDTLRRIRSIKWTRALKPHLGSDTVDPYLWTQLIFVIKARDFIPEENLFKYNQFMVTYISNVLQEVTKEYLETTNALSMMTDSTITDSKSVESLGAIQTDAIVVIRLLFSILRSNPFIFSLYRKIVGLNDLVKTIQQILELEKQSDLFIVSDLTRPQRFYLFHEDVELRDLSLIKFNFKDYADRHLYASEDINIVCGDISRYTKNGIPSFLGLEIDPSMSEKEKMAKVRREITKYENKHRQTAVFKSGVSLLQWANHAEYDTTTGEITLIGKFKPIRQKTEYSKSEVTNNVGGFSHIKMNDIGHVRKIEKESHHAVESSSDRNEKLKPSSNGIADPKSSDKSTKIEKGPHNTHEKNQNINKNIKINNENTNNNTVTGASEKIPVRSVLPPGTLHEESNSGSGVWKTEDIEKMLTTSPSPTDNYKSSIDNSVDMNGVENTVRKIKPSNEISFKNLTMREGSELSQSNTGIWLNLGNKESYASSKRTTPYLSPAFQTLLQHQAEGSMHLPHSVMQPAQRAELQSQGTMQQPQSTNQQDNSAMQMPRPAIQQPQRAMQQQSYPYQQSQASLQQQFSNTNQNANSMVQQPQTYFNPIGTSVGFGQFQQPQQDYAVYASNHPLGLNPAANTLGPHHWPALGILNGQQNVQQFSVQPTLQPNMQPYNVQNVQQNVQQQSVYNPQHPLAQQMSQPIQQNIPQYSFQQPIMHQPFVPSNIQPTSMPQANQVNPTNVQQIYPGQFSANGVAPMLMMHPGPMQLSQTPQGQAQPGKSYTWGHQ